MHLRDTAFPFDAENYAAQLGLEKFEYITIKVLCTLLEKVDLESLDRHLAIELTSRAAMVASVAAQVISAEQGE